MRTVIHHDDRRRRRRRLVIIILMLIVFAEVLAFAVGVAALTPVTAVTGAFIGGAVGAALYAVKVFVGLLEKLFAPATVEV